MLVSDESHICLGVAVQTPMMVKISDFGLSKMLDIDEGHFQSVGEKVRHTNANCRVWR